MNRSPVLPTATPFGSATDALVAGPPSPGFTTTFPPPATVLMIPAGVTLRIRLLRRSAMNRFPAASTATPRGVIPALVAGPPSPEYWLLPFPATVVIRPAGLIL